MSKKHLRQSTPILWLSLAVALISAAIFSRIDRENFGRFVGTPVLSFKKGSTELPLNQTAYNPTNESNRFLFHFRASFRPRFDRPYQNLFQTSSGNGGIRFELGSTGVGALIVGHDGAFTTLALGETFQSETDYELEIWGTGSRIEILVNGRHETRPIYMRDIPRFNEIAFGNGFDGTRKFSGSLLNYSMEINTFFVNRPLAWSFHLLRLAIVCVGLVSGWIFSLSLLTGNSRGPQL